MRRWLSGTKRPGGANDNAPRAPASSGRPRPRRDRDQVTGAGTRAVRPHRDLHGYGPQSAEALLYPERAFVPASSSCLWTAGWRCRWRLGPASARGGSATALPGGYYVRLERGRNPNVSDAVLDAVARALRLCPPA